MGVWVSFEFHVLGGLTVQGDITDDAAKDLLAQQGRYIFATADLDDHEKVVRMASTKIAFALEKKTGTFVFTDKDGRFWLIPNAHIVAAAIIEPGGKRRGMGFGQMDDSVRLRKG